MSHSSETAPNAGQPQGKPPLGLIEFVALMATMTSLVALSILRLALLCVCRPLI